MAQLSLTELTELVVCTHQDDETGDASLYWYLHELIIKGGRLSYSTPDFLRAYLTWANGSPTYQALHDRNN